MDFFLALVAVLAISLFFVVRFKLNAAVAPFFTIAAITVWMCVVCMTGLLIVAVWAVFLFAVFSLIYVFVIKKEPLHSVAEAFFKPGMVFFIATSVLFFILLSIKNPYFGSWDEFSFWGIAAKGVFENRQIYTLFESSMINTSYQPALPLWSFFVQFFGRAFTEWKVYLAYDVMIMSVMAMLFSRIKWKNVATVVILFCFGLFSLYLFWHTFDGKVLYCTSYADIQIGVVFGGALLSHFFAEDNRLLKWIVSLAGVMLLPMLKDIGMALGLIVAGIILVDTVLTGSYPTDTLFKSNRKLVRVLLPLLLFVAVLAIYQLWNIHYAAVSVGDRSISAYDYSFVEIILGNDPYFNEVLKRMIATLPVTQLVAFGPMTTMIAVFTLIPVIAGVLSFDKKKIIRLTCYSLLLLGGFFAYYLFHAYSYAAIFAHSKFDLINLTRYMSTYCSGWMIASVGICFFETALPKLKKCDLLIASTVAALIVFSSFYSTYHFDHVHPDQYIFTSSKIDLSMEGVRAMIHEQAMEFDGMFMLEDNFYFVCQDSDGGEWFRFNYEFMPARTEQTLERGNFVSMDTPKSDYGYYDVAVDADRFIAFIREKNINYLFILQPNEYFYKEFAPLFSDYLAGYADRSAYIYMVVDNGGDDFTCVPVSEARFLPGLKEQYNVA